MILRAEGRVIKVNGHTSMNMAENIANLLTTNYTSGQVKTPGAHTCQSGNLAIWQVVFQLHD